MTVFYRVATLHDSEALAILLPDLGYTASCDDVLTRLSIVLSDTRHAIFVAEYNCTVIGMCHVTEVRNIASSGYAEILEIVVASAHQGQGIGKHLLKSAEKWAAVRLFSRVRLRSGVHRSEAHQFYEKLGYEKTRASFAFELQLAKF